ncbi:MAG TPA: hypothetical protein VE934_08195 [Polaromonas sp.]|uniref:hypothetical protein n=1 Tax=Polaromonas sp. TaxID=1869339 RepID=UPI002D3896A3|nr:hypothetical protein [Polaromonas sp.]HYW56926.1 hypothetical protein [Polaromonas sp.]
MALSNLQHQPLCQLICIVRFNTGISQSPFESIAKLGFFVGVQLVLLLEPNDLIGHLPQNLVGLLLEGLIAKLLGRWKFFSEETREGAAKLFRFCSIKPVENHVASKFQSFSSLGLVFGFSYRAIHLAFGNIIVGHMDRPSSGGN